MKNTKWVIFNNQGTDKCLSADFNKDGVLDTDVIVSRTPWYGAPKTENDYNFLISLVEQYAVPEEEIEIEFPWDAWETD